MNKVALLAMLAGAATTASAQFSITWSANIEDFGGSDPVSSNEVLIWSASFSLGDGASFTALDMDLAHNYGGDLTMRLINDTTGTAYYFFGTEGAIGTDPLIADGDSIFDADEFGDGAGFLLANTETYTLVESSATDTFLTDTSGLVAPGTYNAQGWASGVFSAADWTIELWDTWASVDEGSLGDVTIHYNIPAPGSIAMLGLGGLAAVRRRR